LAFDATLSYPCDSKSNTKDVKQQEAIWTFAQAHCLNGISVTYLDLGGNSGAVQEALQRVVNTIQTRPHNWKLASNTILR
jgi:hypothetical protein